MLYVLIDFNGRASGVAPGYREANAACHGLGAFKWENRNDWPSFERAEKVAAELSAETGLLFIATDAGPHVSPRYDVIEPPKVGDEVSYAFNGDSYPDGKIVSVSKSLRVVRTENSAYYRHRMSGSWIRNGTWSLQPGHASKRNPHF